MKKVVFVFLAIFITTTCFASDYIQQEVTSEVYTEQVQVTTQNYNGYRQQQPCLQRQMAPRGYNLRPVTVHTGRTVVVKDHYDVYQPRVVYDKVNSYTTTKTCEYCD